MKKQIYLDYASTTPMDPRVLEAMLPYLGASHNVMSKNESGAASNAEPLYGNPSSIHQFGQRTRKAIDEARNTIIELLGAFSVHEIIFTGSGTESCNMAIMGAAFAQRESGKHIIISGIEHPAIRETAYVLRDHFGFELTELMPTPEGIITLESLKKAIQPETILVSVMYANNEIGTVQPIQELAAFCREKGILFHTDACQAPGYLPLNVAELGVDLLTLNGSKVYGPKGVGLLYIREGVQILPLIHGGGQEFRMRGGTENPALIVGFAKALQLLLGQTAEEKAAAEEEQKRIKGLRDQLLDGILEWSFQKDLGVELNGSRKNRLDNNINIHVPGKSGESLVMRLDIEGLATSSGSACSAGKIEASHVLMAMGQSRDKASQSLRLSLGRPTTQEEVERALAILKNL